MSNVDQFAWGCHTSMQYHNAVAWKHVITCDFWRSIKITLLSSIWEGITSCQHCQQQVQQLSWQMSSTMTGQFCKQCILQSCTPSAAAECFLCFAGVYPFSNALLVESRKTTAPNPAVPPSAQSQAIGAGGWVSWTTHTTRLGSWWWPWDRHCPCEVICPCSCSCGKLSHPCLPSHQESFQGWHQWQHAAHGKACPLCSSASLHQEIPFDCFE